MIDLDALIGLRLSHRREEVGVKQETLAIDLGVDQSTISNYESGSVSIPAVNLVLIAAALGVTSGYFTKGADEYIPADIDRMRSSKATKPSDIRKHLARASFKDIGHYNMVTRFIKVLGDT